MGAWCERGYACSFVINGQRQLQSVIESSEEVHIFPKEICISLGDLHIPLEEIHKWAREICISSRELANSSRGSPYFSKESANSLKESWQSSLDFRDGFQGQKEPEA